MRVIYIPRDYRRNFSSFRIFRYTLPRTSFFLLLPLIMNPIAKIAYNGQYFTRLCLSANSRVRSKSCRLIQRWSSSYSTKSSATQKTIFSGIQPTGVPHLGNYLGALREWIQLQNNATERTKLLFSVVDLHALTVPQDASRLRNWREEMLAILLAVGLDPARSAIFYQSAVSNIGF